MNARVMNIRYLYQFHIVSIPKGLNHTLKLLDTTLPFYFYAVSTGSSSTQGNSVL